MCFISPQKLKKKDLNKPLANTRALTATVLHTHFVQYSNPWLAVRFSEKELRKGLIYHLCCQHYI